jgi:hypothetical protein
MVYIAYRNLTLEEIAKAEGFGPTYATRLFACWHRAELTARGLMDDTRLPLAWLQQRHQLGFNTGQAVRWLRVHLSLYLWCVARREPTSDARDSRTH